MERWQVAYRFCSTLGADSVSHFLADRVVAPPELQPSVSPVPTAMTRTLVGVSPPPFFGLAPPCPQRGACQGTRCRTSVRVSMLIIFGVHPKPLNPQP